MKVFFVALLAACFIQGYHGSPSPFLGSSYVTGAIGSATNLVSNTAGAAANLLTGAVTPVTANVPLLTEQEQAAIEILDKTHSATPQQILEVDAKVKEQVSSITNVQNQVTEKANSIYNSLKSYITTVEEEQKEGAGEIVKDILEKAEDKEAVKSCALSSIAQLSKTATSTTFSCVTEKLATAKDLLLKAKDLPFRALAVAKAAYVAANACEDAYVKSVCQARKLAPVLLDAAKLVGDTTLLAGRTLKLGNDLRTGTIPCMKEVNKLKSTEAAKVRDYTASCITEKVSNLVGYNKAQ